MNRAAPGRRTRRPGRTVNVYLAPDDRGSLIVPTFWPPGGADPVFQGFGPPVAGSSDDGRRVVLQGRHGRLQLGPMAFVRLCRRRHPGFRPFRDRMPSEENLGVYDGPSVRRRRRRRPEGGDPPWVVAITVNDRRGRCCSIRYIPARERSDYPTTFGERWARRFPTRAQALAWLAGWERKRPGWCYTPLRIT